jgi:16S rRNA processing protein RimM
MIKVGQVVGAFGTDGAVKVLPLTDFGERFERGERLVLGGVEREVVWSRKRAPGFVVKLAGIDNRTLAEMHNGGYLEVVEPKRLPDDRFYHHQLVGLDVRTHSGTRLGRIRDVLERPANDVWVATREDVEVLIPATRDAVIEVDVERGEVVVADWLLDVEDA